MKKSIRIQFLLMLSLFVTNVYGDNFTINSVQLLPNTIQKVNIILNNESEHATAFQLDLVLPKGITVSKDNSGKLLASLNANRANSHQIFSAEVGANTYRILAYSTSNKVISGTKDYLVQLDLVVDKDIVPGTKTIGLKSMLLVDADGTQLNFEDKTIKVSVSAAETASITIGGKGLTTFTSKYNLDFSGFGDEVKAYVATGYDYDTKTIWLTRVKDVPAGTALMVKGAAGKTYEVPVKQTSGSYYKNMFVGNTTGSDMVLSETSDGMTNYYLKDGEFKSVKTSANIVDGKSYLQIPTAAPTAKAGSSQTMTMNAYGFASYCGSQDLDFTDVEGLKAYAATGYDDATGTIWLTRVMRVSAGTPLLLMGAPSTEDKVSSYTVPSSAVSSYYTNMLKGNTGTEDLIINTTEGDMTNYYLKGNQLLKVSGTANIHPGKAYMQIPTRHVTRAEEDVVSGAPYYNIGEEPEVISMQIGTRGIEGDGEDTTGISETVITDQEPDVYYNLQGQRVENPGKGIYIKNGQKVIIK